jgi:histone-lysine N-methyltransferase SETD1
MNGEMPTQTETQSQTQTSNQLQSHNNNQNVHQINHNISHNKPQPQQHPIPGSVDPTKEKKLRNYKLIADPALKKGLTKIYRYDGLVPGVSHPNPH